MRNAKLAQFLGVFRQAMRLPVEEELKAVLRPAQKAIGIVQCAILGIGQTTGRLERLHGVERTSLANGRQVAAIEKLQELNGELDVANTPATGLHVTFAIPGVVRLVFDSPFHCLDFVDFREAQILSPDESFDGAKKVFTKRTIAGNGTDFNQCLSLPGAAVCVVIRKGACQRACERPALPFRPKPEINPIGLASIGMRGQCSNHLRDNAGPEFVISNNGAAAARPPVLIVDYHQINVARIVELFSAEFSKPKYDALRRLAI